MNGYVTLTAADRLVLESYKSVIEGLSELLGPGYEILLHSLEDLDRSAIKVVNGHYTGRSVGAPITDLALQMLAAIRRSGDNHKSLIYFNRSRRGTPIRSATIPIMGENDRIIGLLCINFYLEIPLNTYLENLLKVSEEQRELKETFAGSTDELITTAIENARAEVMSNPKIAASNKNKEIIALLNQKEIFNLKDAVLKVAETLGISKNTVYLHLRHLSQ